MKGHLLKYLEDYNLLKVAEGAFKKSFSTYKIEEKNEYLSLIENREVDILLNSIAYHILVNEEKDVIIIKYNIICDNKLIGNYRLVVDYQTHQLIDDYLVFE